MTATTVTDCILPRAFCRRCRFFV